jgi:O-antigen/teichoic acid export membrane protein
MRDTPYKRAGRLGHLTDQQRHLILSGMRWTVWLSAITIPFSVAVNLLLARVGPETLGVYGLLSVYISLTSAFLYFGGDTVVMRFMPQCDGEDRASFLISYFAVILAVMSGWLTFLWFCPGAMRLAFGDEFNSRFSFLLLGLSVVPTFFAMMIAALKGMLEIRVSQLLTKCLTLGSLVIYAAIYCFHRSLLSVHPSLVIWSVYFGLSAVLGVGGAIKVGQLCRAKRLRWFLPMGFWRYSFNTQQVSAVTFLARKLDYVLIANFGGLKLLGEYVAINAIAYVIPVVGSFFMDTLLPALTNTIAVRNHSGAAQIFTMHMRILFMVMTATSCAVMVLAVPATVVMGSKYSSLGGLIIFMAAAYGISTPGICGGTVLASIGRQRLGIWALLINLVLFVCLFASLWWRFSLTGAVIAYGVALVISNAILMSIALRVAPFFSSISTLWLKAAVVQALVSFVALWWMPLGLASAALVWVGAVVIFLWLARYSPSECVDLIRTFLPRSGVNAFNETNPPHVESIHRSVASL